MSAKQLFSRALLFNRAPTAARSYHGGSHKAPTMNDLPVPQGDWYEAHARRNSRYNAILATGVLVLAGTIGFAKSSGLIHLNYSPPKSLD